MIKIFRLCALIVFLVASPALCENIIIPGYRLLTFSANKRVQDVRFYNPPENNCSFKLSLVMPDGVSLWTSDLLEPGNIFVKIMLSKSLTRGVYQDCILKYECYSLDGLRELNGAEIKLTLDVK
ncbi:MAG: hypothetical protein IJU48_04645 [Synergistaceae bacterium]|nr:hypothetical protein [Synergistaceae bacterium]